MTTGGGSGIPPGAVEQIYVVEVTYGQDAERLRPAFRTEHLTRIKKLMEEGRVIEAGGYRDFSTSLLLVRADSEEEALDLFRNDVYVRNDVWATLRANRSGES